MRYSRLSRQEQQNKARAGGEWRCVGVDSAFHHRDGAPWAERTIAKSALIGQRMTGEDGRPRALRAR